MAEALVGLKAWRDLAAPIRAILFVAALLPDGGKPATTRLEDGAWTSPGHSRRGAHLAREFLWWEGVAHGPRERVAHLVRRHQVLFHLLERPEAEKLALRCSWTAGCAELALLARADTLGRVCDDQADLLETVACAHQLCEELGCGSSPFPFPSDRARFEYFRRPDRDPRYDPYDDARCEVVLMSGLPGVGKDTWIARHAAHLPVVSLDRVRRELGVDPEEDQGHVVQAAREQARVYLRAGQGFVWNATNVSRSLRGQLIDLFVDYHARIRIVAVEASPGRLLLQNRGRGHPGPRSSCGPPERKPAFTGIGAG